MLESFYVIFLVISIGLIAYAFAKRDSAILLLASVLVMGSGLMLLDTSSDSGLEQDNGFIVRSLGDDNFSVDNNVTFRNAGNDLGLRTLGNVLFWGGTVGILFSLGFIISAHRHRGV